MALAMRKRLARAVLGGAELAADAAAMRRALASDASRRAGQPRLALVVAPVPVEERRLDALPGPGLELETPNLASRYDGPTWEELGGAPEDEAADAAAAVRAHLADPTPYGPHVRAVMLVGEHGGAGEEEVVVAEGRLSAWHRTFPDAMTRAGWGTAGVLGLEAPGMPLAKRVELRP